MQPGNCSTSWNLAPGEETLWLWCSTDGFELTATIDGTTFEVTESTFGPATSSSIALHDRQAPMLTAGY
jgi:hypothetical protein